MKAILLVTLYFISLGSYSQEKQNASGLITETIENYFYGYIERDGEKLRRAFDMVNGTMKIPKSGENGITAFTNAYFKELIPRWAGRAKLSASELKNCYLTILSMDIESGEIASAKMKMEVGNKTYIDILSLQKIKGEWKITNKIYIEL